ncbi:hypothetical protein OAS89_00760 [Alphaproteobacteria bacterium]|nr:hypothetical protein [Alphaproteobacteria bacterium]
MMTRFVLTLLIGLVVSLGALVSGGSGVAWAGNWNLSDTEKVSATFTSLNDQKLCFYATTQYSTGRVLDYIWNPDPSYKGHVEEAKRRFLKCNVDENLNKKLSAESTKQPTSRLIGETANVFTNQPDHNVCLNVQVNADAQVEAKRRNLGCGVDKDRQDADKIRKKLASRDYGAGQLCLWLKEAKKSSPAYHAYSDEAKRRSLVCPCINYPNNSECHERLAEVDNTWLCYHAVTAGLLHERR